MKSYFLQSLIVLFVFTHGGIGFSQQSSGSGGGGTKPPVKTKPYSGPAVPELEDGVPCTEEDDMYCNYNFPTLREFEKMLLPLLANKQAHCLSFPVKYNSIVEFYNHYMIQILVGKLRVENKKVSCGEAITGAGTGFRSCFLDDNLKQWLDHFLYYPKSLSLYLQSEHNLSADEANQLIDALFIIKG